MSCSTLSFFKLCEALQVSALVVASEVVSSPSPGDIKKGMAKLARHIVECGLSFVRWKDGTCIECPEVPGPVDDDEPYLHT